MTWKVTIITNLLESPSKSDSMSRKTAIQVSVLTDNSEEVFSLVLVEELGWGRKQPTFKGFGGCSRCSESYNTYCASTVRLGWSWCLLLSSLLLTCPALCVLHIGQQFSGYTEVPRRESLGNSGTTWAWVSTSPRWPSWPCQSWAYHLTFQRLSFLIHETQGEILNL